MTQDQAIAAGVISNYSQQTESDGGQLDVYTFSNGLTATYYTPPPGFSPLTATDAQLAKYGFPPRPTSSTQLQLWTQLMTAWKPSPRPYLEIATSPSVTSAPASGFFDLASNTDQTLESNWDGYDDNSTYQEYSGEEADFTVPTIGKDCISGDGPHTGMWTGLGGVNAGSDGSKRLMQSGIVYNDFSPEPTKWQPFWELVSTYVSFNPVQMVSASDTAISVHPGDLVYSKTYYDASNDSIGFYLEDTTTGATASETIDSNNTITGNPANWYDGSTAETILEFPPPTDSNDAHFADFQVSNAETQIAATDDWDYLGDLSNAEWADMPFMNPGPLTSPEEDDFTENFDSCP